MSRLEIKRGQPSHLLCRVSWRCGTKPAKCRRYLRKRGKKPSKCAAWRAKTKANAELARALRRQVKFRSGSTVLTKQGKRILNGVAGTLIRYPWMRVTVEGHSPARGNWGKRLTSGRARTSARYLRTRGCRNGFRQVGKRTNLIGIKMHASGNTRRPKGCRAGVEKCVPFFRISFLLHAIKFFWNVCLVASPICL